MLTSNQCRTTATKRIIDRIADFGAVKNQSAEESDWFHGRVELALRRLWVERD